jgi:hypothetical protein
MGDRSTALQRETCVVQEATATLQLQTSTEPPLKQKMQISNFRPAMHHCIHVALQ